MFKLNQRVKSLITRNIGTVIDISKNNLLNCLKHDVQHSNIITIKWDSHNNNSTQVSCDLDNIKII